MVRFLRSTCEEFGSQAELNRFLLTERVFALFHVPAALCLAAGNLMACGLAPFTVAIDRQLVLGAAAFLVIANGRDAQQCSRNFYHRRTEGRYASSRARGGLYSSIGGQMHMVAAFLMTLGSLSLMNSCLISLFRTGTGAKDLCAKQCALAFSLMFVGAASNNLSIDPLLSKLHGTRMLLGFQNIICCAALSLSSLLSLPNFGFEKADTTHKLVISISTSIGCGMILMSAIMQYFYILSFTWLQLDFFYDTQAERRKKRARKTKVRSRRMKTPKPTLPKPGYLATIRTAIARGGRSLLRKDPSPKQAVTKDRRETAALTNMSDLSFEKGGYRQNHDSITITSEGCESSVASDASEYTSDDEVYSRRRRKWKYTGDEVQP